MKMDFHLHIKLAGVLHAKDESQLCEVLKTFYEQQGQELTLSLLSSLTFNISNHKLKLPHAALFLHMPRLFDQIISYGYSASEAFFHPLDTNSPLICRVVFDNDSRVFLHLVKNYLEFLVEHPDFKLNALIYITEHYIENTLISAQIKSIVLEKRATLSNEFIAALKGNSEPSLEKWSYWLKFFGEYTLQETKMKNNCSLSDGFETISYSNESNIAFPIVEKNWMKSFIFLLEKRIITLQDKAVCPTGLNTKLHDVTLLMEACENDSDQIIEYLLATITSSGEFCLKNGFNENVLFYVRSPIVFDKLYEKANQLGCLETLFKTISERKNNFVIDHIYLGRHELEKYIFTKCTTEIARYYDIPEIASTVNAMYWENPQAHLVWEDLAQHIKALYPHTIIYQPLPVDLHPASTDWMDSYNRVNYQIFFDKVCYDSAISKDTALEFCHTQLYSIFKKNAISCIPYLSYLSKKLEDYYFTKHKTPFPQLDHHGFDFKPINRFYYPVPKQGQYQGIKKQSALQEYLMGLFHQYGMGNQAAKWIGFIPKENAEAWINEGHFFMEERLGEGLFHGKLIHMIHWALIISLHQANVLKVDYHEDGQVKKLTPKEIITHLVKKQTVEGELLWNIVIDGGEQNAFNLPYALYTFIMHQGRKHNMQALSDSLIDTFCKGYVQLYHTHNKHMKINKSWDDFYELIKDQHISTFHIYRALLSYARRKEEAKGNIATTAPLMNSYIAKREYQVNDEFDFKIDKVDSHAFTP
jgi:hypothetical protein